MKKLVKKTGFLLLAVSMFSLPVVSSAMAADTLRPGQSISHDGKLTSSDGRFNFVMQWDGNLVHYQGGSSLWDSDTRGDKVEIWDPFLGRYFYRYAEVLKLDSSGNLYITDLEGRFMFWRADTAAWMQGWYHPPMVVPTGLVGDTLIAQNDGNVVLYDTIGNYNGEWKPVWATNTGGR